MGGGEGGGGERKREATFLSLFFSFPSLPALELLTRYQLPLAPFCSFPVSQSLFCAKNKIYGKPVEEAETFGS